MITTRSNIVVIPLVRDCLIIISHIATHKFKLCNKNKNCRVLAIDGYCTCRINPISYKSDGSLYCRVMVLSSIKQVYFHL